MRLFRAANFDNSIFTETSQPAANTHPAYNLDLASLDGEKWRDIVGYEGSYQISSLGRVKSLERTIPHNGRSIHIHDLMLTAFVGPRPDGMECRHLNDIPTDNRPENLCWGTYQENRQDMVRNGKPLRIYKNNKSGVIGVSWWNSGQKWCVTLGQRTLGRFEKKEDAIAARKAAERKRFG